ncbi:YidB family protein [Acidovorax sp.]|uniref:YidB family protein n=1 Tax=Acidovorax sp. TaxID=1872122 RepID=UPI00260353DF|nr:YidB family protein [Acidovorax sp.]
MGLLDSVLGAVINNASQGGAHAQANGDAAGGLGGLLSMAAQNPQLIQAVMSLISNDGPVGGLPGLMAKFQQAGMGNVLASWLGSGPNHAISGEQLTQVLGNGPLSQIAAQLGMGSHAAAGQLAQVLPGLVDQLSPQGQAPQGGFGDANDLFGMLGGLLQK